MVSELSKLIDDEMLKEDCKNLSEFNKMKDSKIFQILNETLQEFIDDNKYDYETVVTLYRYYGRILNKLKGECA